MPAARYPKATWRGDGRSGGSYTSGPFKLVVHTTETSGIPSYDNAPHVTYYPAKREFVQHLSFLEAARALRNETGGVHTNRDSAIQLEIVAYSQESIVDKYPNTGRIKVSELTAEHLADIREFILWVCSEFGVEYKWPERQAFSYRQANTPGFRMTHEEWDAYDGVCGHQHVPENVHWDPGGINWIALMEEELSPTNWTEEDKQVVADLILANSIGASVGRGDNRQTVASVIVEARNLAKSISSTVTLTKTQVAAIAASGVAAGATAPEIVAEIGRLLGG